MKDNEGFGTRSNFVINLCEDSLVTVDNDYWEGQLKVVGIRENHKDTVILSIGINKSVKNTPIEFSVDSVQKIHIMLTFPAGSHYNNVDTLFYIGHLTQHPSIKLPIKKILPRLYTYESKVVMNLNGTMVELQDAIVILREQICRTNQNGIFCFNLEDSLSAKDVMYIVRKGFKVFESDNILTDEQLKSYFVIEPSDSLQAFKQQCLVIDSVPIQKWTYRTVNSKMPHGPIVKFKDHVFDDRVILYGKVAKKRTGSYDIWGYYYYLSEYNRKKKLGDPYAAYYIFSGVMDATDFKKNKKKGSKPFDIRSYNIVGNKQHLKGLLYSSGKWSGDIYVGEVKIGDFGK